MAWQAIIAMLPPILIRLLIEKLVALIVPAAAAIMAIVEALQAAWGTISAIMAALDTFIAFLKAVKGGGAGPQFAKALASAAVVVLDFVANFLLLRLAKGLAKLAGKLMGFARRMMRKLRRRRKAGRRRGRGRARGPQRNRPRNRRQNDADRRERQRREKLARLNRAKAELPPKINALMSRGVNGIFLRGRLLIWRLQYRLTSLSVSGSGRSFRIIAKVNPSVDVGHGVSMDRDELLKYVRELATEILSRPDVQAQANEILATQGTKTNASGATIQTVTVPLGTSIPARVAAGQRLPELNKGQHREVTYAGTDTSVRQVQSPYREGRQHQLVKEVTNDGLDAKKYVDLAKEFGSNGPGLAQALISFRKTGKVPEGFDSKQIAALQELMFSQETIRSPAALVQAQMSLDLMAKNKATPQEIFGTDPKQGGLFPMSAKGAQGRSAQVDKALADPSSAGRKGHAARDVQMQREVALIRTWLNALDLKFAQEASQEQKIVEIKTQIRHRMLRAFGLRD